MTTYLIRRILYGVLIIFLTSIVMFTVVTIDPAGGPTNEAWNLVPTSDPVFLAKPPAERKAIIDKMKHDLGLDDPIPILYLRWLYDWHPKQENDPAAIEAILKQEQDELAIDPSLLTEAQRQDLAQQRPSIEQDVASLQQQLAAASQKLASCNDLLNFDNLGRCLSVPRVGGLLSGNLGQGVAESIFGRSAGQAPDPNTGEMVSAADTHLRSPFVNTMILIAFALLLALLVAFPVAIYSAMRQHSLGDYLLSMLTFAGMALPVFWLGAIMLLLNFKLQMAGLPALPIKGVVDDPGKVEQYGDVGMRLKHLLIPGAVLGLAYMAGFSRFLRSSMLEVLGQEYVRTAWAKGLRPRTVILKHALRNALIPLVTRIALSLPLMLGSVVIVERIFQYDGLGLLIYNAVGVARINATGWTTIMGVIIVSSLIVIISSIIADFAYAVIDPRIRYS